MMKEVQAGPHLTEASARALAQALDERLAHQDRVSFAVSGGRTPWAVFRALAEAPLDWRRVDIYQVDERVAPDDDPARNLMGLSDALLDRVDAVAHPMPVTHPDLPSAAAQYASELPPSLDVAHLGLGDDGHTASLVPGDPALDEGDRLVTLTRPYRGHRRMTLTYLALARARLIVWIVAGEDKRAMLDRLRAGDATIPAGRVPQGRALLLTDELPIG